MPALKFWTVSGAALLAVAVMLGAFGAHGLRGRLDAYSMGIYERAVFYHFIHALGVLIVAALARSGALEPKPALLTAALLTLGILIFSGSLYLLAVTGTRWLGAITPLGGLSFIAAWLLLTWALLRGA